MSAARRLLVWYRRQRRALPWRATTEPYRVWVSEVMLQQTRVETVRPYFERFIARFPDLATLAAAPLDAVLAQWSGLGYYRRARQLHAAAGELMAAGGRWPRSAAELRRLPGVGPYTAAAVASIAFGEPVAAVDGNVQRVVARLTGRRRIPTRVAGRRRLETEAAALLDPARPGDSNQALMELGATVCTPRRPACPRCPLAADCLAATNGRPERFARPRQARPARRIERLVVVVERGERLLLFRRPESSRRLAGTWELPWSERRNRPAAEADLARRFGGRWDLAAAAGSFRHAITTRDLRIEVRRGRWSSRGVSEGPEVGWFRRGELSDLPLSSQVAKALSLLPPETRAAGAR